MAEFTKLELACRDGKLKEVERLIAKGAKVDGSASKKFEGNVRYLKTGAPFWTPLLFATRAGHEKIVKRLLEAGAPVDEADYNRDTPFLAALQAGQLQVARLLLDAGADKDALGQFGNAVYYAIDSEDCTIEMVRFVLELGVDPTVTKRGQDALGRLTTCVAFARKKPPLELEILELLKKHWIGDATRVDQALIESRAALGKKSKTESSKSKSKR